MKQYMKRFGIITGLALVALALTNCNKELDAPEQNTAKKDGIPFQVIAVPSEATRTTVDGNNTSWAENDAINLFHAVAGETVYTSDGKFTISNLTTGQFDGTVSSTNSPVSGTAYDWYAMYPYASGLSTINGTDGTNWYYTLGSTYNGSQTQASVNSTAHLANLPLYGIKKNATYNGSAPFIQMNQLASVAAITITNNTKAAINISQISLTAPENIVGTYRFNILGENVVYTPSGSSYVSTTAKLNVTDGTLAKDAAGVFYIAIKPFTAPSGSKITLTVSTDAGVSQTKEFNLAKNYTFSAGKMKTVSMNFTKEITDPSTVTWNLCKDASALSVGTEVLIAANGYDFAMSTTQNSNNRGQVGVTKSGDELMTTSSSAQVFELVAGTYTTSTSYGFRCVNGDEAGNYIYAASKSSNHLKTTSTLNDNGSFTISITPAGVATITAKGTNTRNLLQYNTSGWFACYGSAQKDVSIYTKGESTSGDTKLITSNGTLTVPASGGEVTIENAYSTQNIESTEVINVNASENLSNVSINNGAITLTMAPKYTSGKLTGESVTLTLASDPTVTVTIPVEQEGSSLTVSSSTVTIPSDATSATFTVTSKDFGFSISSNDSGVTVNPSSSEASDDPVTITVSSTAASAATETTLGMLTISRTTDDPQEKTVTVKKAAKAEEGSAWIRTAITDLAAGDLIAIVDVTSNMAMSNNNGTSSAPATTSVTLTADKSRLTAEPAATLQWIFGGNATDGYTFNVSGTNNYLYCTSSNNGVRVGVNTNNTFTIDNNFLKNKATSRYIGVYNNQDWRCYTSINSNIVNTSIAFYKKTGGSSGGTVWNLTGISITTPPTKTTYYAGESFDPTGMVVTASYEEAGNTSNTKPETIAIADLTFSPSTEDVLAVSNTSVTVSYSEGGTTKMATQTITVNKATPTLSVSPSPTNVFVGGSQQLTVSGSDGTPSFTSSNPAIAGVSSDGIVSGVAIGTTSITITTSATANYNACSATVTVNVSEVPEALEFESNTDFGDFWKDWTNGYYNSGTFEYGNADIVFSYCAKQTGNMDITTMPVTKTGSVAVVLKSGTLASISYTLVQWTNKVLTASLEYSTDGGANYSPFSPAITHTTSNKTTHAEFTLSAASLPSGTNAVRVVGGSSNGNAFGIKTISFE